MYGGELLPTSGSVTSDVQRASRGALEIENALFFSPRRTRPHSATLPTTHANSPYKRLKTTKTPPKYDMSNGSSHQDRDEDSHESSLECYNDNDEVPPFRSPLSGPCSPTRLRSPVHSRSETYSSSQTRECGPEFASFRIAHGRLRRRRRSRGSGPCTKTEPVTLFADHGSSPEHEHTSKCAGDKTSGAKPDANGLPQQPRESSKRAKGEQYGNVIPSGVGLELEKLCSKLGLSSAIKRRSSDLFRDVINHSAIIDGDLRCALSACVYFACQQENCCFDTHEIAFHLDVSPMEVEKYGRTVGVILGFHYEPVAVKDVMRRVCSKLGISSHLIAASEHVAEAILNLPMKCQPAIYICAASVRLVCQRQSIISCMYTTEKVADVANICVKRLKAFLEDLYPLAEALLPTWLSSPRRNIPLMSPLKNTYAGQNKRSFLVPSPLFASALTPASPMPLTTFEAAPSPFSPAPMPSKLCPPGSPSAFRKLNWTSDPGNDGDGLDSSEHHTHTFQLPHTVAYSTPHPGD